MHKIEQSIYQFQYHGFNNNFSKECLSYLYNQYEDNEEVEMTIENFCNMIKRENVDLIETDDTKLIEVVLNSNALPLPDKLDKSKRNVIVFDDCVASKSQYFIRGRPNSCTVFYLIQSYYDIEKIIRDNSKITILLKQPNKLVTALI